MANGLCGCNPGIRRRENYPSNFAGAAAIDERLNSHAEITPNEHEAIDAAVLKLANLKGQHVELIQPTMPTGDTELAS